MFAILILMAVFTTFMTTPAAMTIYNPHGMSLLLKIPVSYRDNISDQNLQETKGPSNPSL
ncbi:unnamed protein product [Malus baccata var. baccata]